jgi:hypothetical protein
VHDLSHRGVEEAKEPAVDLVLSLRDDRAVLQQPLVSGADRVGDEGQIVPVGLYLHIEVVGYPASDPLVDDLLERRARPHIDGEHHAEQHDEEGADDPADLLQNRPDVRDYGHVNSRVIAAPTIPPTTRATSHPPAPVSAG